MTQVQRSRKLLREMKPEVLFVIVKEKGSQKLAEIRAIKQSWVRENKVSDLREHKRKYS